MSHQVRGMNRRPQIAHIDQKHFVEVLQQLHPTRPRGQSFLQRLCNLTSQLRLEGLHEHLGGLGKVQEHPDFVGPRGDLQWFSRTLTAKSAYVIARCERPLLAQFYSACTSFPTEPDNFRQQTFFCLPTIGEDASTIHEWQGNQTIAKERVFEVNYRKYAQNTLHRVSPTLSAPWWCVHSPIKRRENEILGHVPIDS